MKEKLHVSVEEYTTPNPFTAQVDTTVGELVGLMKKEGVRHVPILDGENIVGIVSERDLTVASKFSDGLSLSAGDIMTPEPLIVYSSESLANVAYQMSEQKIGSAIIIFSDDSSMGIFTSTDALNALVEIISPD
ncbi:MAG: CBS domain-containing protein [Halobacteriovoraceae bacterium]|nr:CBS domain-containing protein [Halobacteriovoraceae bacterium]